MIPNVVQDETVSQTPTFPECLYGGRQSPPTWHTGLCRITRKPSPPSVLFAKRALYGCDVPRRVHRYRNGIRSIPVGGLRNGTSQAHPVDEIVALLGIPFDLGILHYASDKPLSKGRQLGSATLSYRGMDSTYAASVGCAAALVALEKRACLNGRSE